MSFHIAICDDSQPDRNYLAALVRRWAGERSHALHLLEFPSAESFLFQYEEHLDLQILLLDIEMGQMDGVTMAKTLRRKSDTLQIIFVTGYSDYIAEGYEVAALHYLMKPVGEEKLFSVLDRAVDKLKKDERVLILETGGELIRLPIRQIRFAQVQGNYVTLHARQTYTVKKTLAQLSEELGEHFFRVGRSALVNLTVVSRVTKTDIYLNDGAVIPLPRGAYEKINRAIIELD